MAVQTCALLAMSVVAVAAMPGSRLGLVVGSPGEYAVTVDGLDWFDGADTFVTHGGKTYSLHDKSLKLSSARNVSGNDMFGPYEGHVWEWDAGGVPFNTSVRLYSSGRLVVFSQTLPSGASSVSINRDNICTSFPSFSVGSGEEGRGFLQFSGDMMGGKYNYGQWKKGASGLNGGFTNTGPLGVYDGNRTTVVISPFSEFMTASQVVNNGEMGYGIQGGVDSVPPGFTVDTVLVVGNGILKGFENWGDVLLGRYRKDRLHGRSIDLALRYLGYSTDNGAYYYYHTESNKNYEQTLLDVKAYADQEKIPYHYILLDSWWYYKGKGDGVKTWVAMPSIFPDGMEYMYNHTGWPVQGHNRFWASDTTYAKQNGGKWDFLIANQKALPMQQEFWDWLFETSSKWGLVTYEQDWLDVEFDQFPPLTTNATLGRTWLMQFGTAAQKLGMGVQYCMSHCRHILQSVELPSVTQARASGDYHPGGTQWQPLGTTGMFGWALGVMPSKDNYWSTEYQPGSKYGDKTHEPYSALQAAVLSLSMGPVCPSDAVGKSNTALIMRSCTADGTLLQPSRPAIAIDAQFMQKAFGTGGPDGELWFAPCNVSGYTFGVALAVDMKSNPLPPMTRCLCDVAVRSFHYSLTPAEVGLDSGVTHVAVDYNSSSTVLKFSQTDPIVVPSCARHDFHVYNIAPVSQNGWTLLGEVSTKWVGVSPSRFEEITSTSDKLTAVLMGPVGEVVEVSFVAPNASTTSTVSCTIPSSGKVTVVAPGLQCQ